MRTALVLAPYSPVGSPIAALGGARKIQGVIAALQSCFHQVVLVNSAHNEEAPLPASWDRLTIGKAEVPVYLPPRWKKRSVGKLRNLFSVRADVTAVLERFPQPDAVWIYNAYAYEALFLRELLKREAKNKKPKVFLEIEDWPLARLRKGHPKPWLDWAGLQFVLRRADAVLCVNEPLARKVRKPGVPVRVLPGLVDEAILRLSQEKPPFREEGRIRIGYFGGLTKEKGCDLILEAIDASRVRNWRWIISGSGPLAMEFECLASRYPGLRFHGVVSDEELVRLIGECDVIVNPHRPISEMGEGVFPFKVVESVATGRLVISTPLPPSGISEVDSSLVSFRDAGNLLRVLVQAHELYQQQKPDISKAIAAVGRQVSVEALSKWIQAEIMEER